MLVEYNYTRRQCASLTSEAVRPKLELLFVIAFVEQLEGFQIFLDRIHQQIPVKQLLFLISRFAHQAADLLFEFLELVMVQSKLYLTITA